MGTIHTQLSSTERTVTFSPRLLGFVLVSVAIHLTLLGSNPMHWEQNSVGSPALQIRMSTAHNGSKATTQSDPVTAPSSAKVQQPNQYQVQKESRPLPVKKTFSHPTVAATPVKSSADKPIPTQRLTEKVPVVKHREPTTRVQQAITTPTPQTLITTTQEPPLTGDEQKATIVVNANAHMRDELTLRLQQALSNHFSYPFLARRRGWQGEVILAFTLESDGQILDIRIA
ncbi:MAG: hypothetical protein GQ470_00035, partial [Gammaproteobacteria bacterium]|nr:hypothetical protein [Gammaproteobacteria bacterium]